MFTSSLQDPHEGHFIMEGLTPVQSRMYEVLRDGLPHTKMELHACLEDELGPLKNISAHLTALRKILRPLGHDIICQEPHSRGGESLYRLVRLLASAVDEVK